MPKKKGPGKESVPDYPKTAGQNLRLYSRNLVCIVLVDRKSGGEAHRHRRFKTRSLARFGMTRLEYCWPAELDRSPAPPLCAARAAAPLRDAPEAARLARYPAVGGAGASDASSSFERGGSFPRPCAPWLRSHDADGPAPFVPFRRFSPDFGRPLRPSCGIRRISERCSPGEDLRGRQLGWRPDPSRWRLPRLPGRRPGWSGPSTA